MKYTWIDDYCMAKEGTEKEYKEEWKALRYMICDKMYVLMCNDNAGNAIMTVKLEQPYGEHLRNQYSDIVPGYYMNKQHWNSLDLNGDVPDDVVKNMLDQSYSLVRASLSQKLLKQLDLDKQ